MQETDVYNNSAADIGLTELAERAIRDSDVASGVEVSVAMTFSAQRNQIVEVVVSECAAKPYMVNVKLTRAPTLLASPPIPVENLPVKGSV